MISFNETISPDDHMLTAGPDAYFNTTRSGLTCVLDGLKAADREPETIKSVLDFGSGYGRVYRALAAKFPEATLTACDLMEPAARFCAETFGGDWVKSSEDLKGMSFSRKYDLIWLGSVFTHLPSQRWTQLLDFLAEAAEKDGIVVFTTHGSRSINVIENTLMKRNPHAIDAVLWAEMKEELPSRGFYFIPNKPAAIRHQNERGIEVTEGEYGFSFSTEEWVRSLIEDLPEWQFVNYAAPGWANNHDAVVLRRR